jgi:hypothetical protein
MRTPLLTPQVVKTLIFVASLVAAGAIAFHYYQPESSWKKCALFAIKATTTSGVPDNSSSIIQSFLIAYLPLSVFSWAALVDALVNRKARFTRPPSA